MPKNGTAQSVKPKRARGRPRLEARREEVLTRAAALFNSRGYAAATLEDIATELGMTRPALYYYAESKEALLDQCYIWGFEKLLSLLEGKLEGGTGRERLVRFFHIYSDAVCDDSSRCFLASETHFLSADRQQGAARRIQHINEIVSDLLEQGMADGSITPCDRRYALLVLFGSFNMLPKLYKDGGPSPRQIGDTLIQMVLNGLIPRSGQGDATQTAVA
jgi:AcrR family transcriptional regulator